MGEEVEDSQESIDLLESIHSPRTLQEMRDFWANQHVESSHRIKPLPRGTFGINKGVQREINPSTLFSPNTSTRELNMELLPKELHQLREDGECHHLSNRTCVLIKIFIDSTFISWKNVRPCISVYCQTFAS